MAGKATDHLRKVEEELSCSVCLGLYKNPKGLPCQHSFCQDCLLPFPLENRRGEYFLKCPLCRKLVQVPDGDVFALPPAFTINNFLRLHKQLMAEFDMCSQHRHLLEAFCENCKELACYECTFSSHVGHHVRPVSEISGDYQKELNEILQPAKQKLASVLDFIQDLNAYIEAISYHGKTVEQQIHSQAQEARAALDQVERKLVQEARVAVQQKRDMISSQLEEVKTKVVLLEDAIACVEESINKFSHQQIVYNKHQMLYRLKEKLSLVTSLKLQPVEKDDVTFECNAGVMQECLKLGSLRFSCLPQQCHLALEPAVPGIESHCILSVCDTSGSLLSIPEKLISCHISAISGVQPTGCNLTETTPGKYQISYCLRSRGPHQLRVMVGGRGIPGSTFSVPVQPPVPQSRGELLHTVQRLHCPVGVALLSNGGVVVSEHRSNSVTIFNAGMRRIEGSLRSSTELLSPEGIAVTKDDHILVADAGHHCIKMLTMKKLVVSCVGSQGNGQLKFSKPAGIVVHPSELVLVSDMDNHCIQVLNKDLTFSHSFGVHGLRPGEFNGPYGLAVDSKGVLYIADAGNCVIHKYSVTGEYLGCIGSKGAAYGQLDTPIGIAIDARDHLYVSEWGNNRISIFTNCGKILNCFGREGKGSGEFRVPCGLAVDKHGNLLVCDYGNNRMILF